jgi:hypothetical protein
MPQRHEDTKVHKDFYFNNLALVQLCAFEPWWHKKYILERTQELKSWRWDFRNFED